jgi:hypothetical protein
MPPHHENQRKHDPHELEGVKGRSHKARSFPWIRFSIFVLVCGLIIALNGPLPGKIWRKINSLRKEKRERVSERKPEEAQTKAAAKQVAAPKLIIQPPVDHTASSGGDIRRMSKGFMLKTEVTVEKGDCASAERTRDESYTAHYELKIKLPVAATTLPGLELNTPGLNSLLPGLAEMMPGAKVSGFFYRLYENKTERLKKNATTLNELMTRHNFYDCETMLNLQHPRTGRRVLLLQAEMDVVSDGSDGDRLPVMPEKIVNSSNYQAMTSYGWKKTGTTPNPLIAGWKNRIRKAEEEIALADTAEDRRNWLRGRITMIKREIQDMEARSYLIADHDPFVVMPINMVTSRGDRHAARIGDYAVVVYDGKIYPSIVGDAGPSFKVGEASLRMCKQLNPNAGIYSRPVSDLTVTYLVFPGSADRFQEPDYGKWQQQCASLLAEVGGLGPNVTLHSWTSTLPIIGEQESAAPEEEEADALPKTPKQPEAPAEEAPAVEGQS